MRDRLFRSWVYLKLGGTIWHNIMIMIDYDAIGIWIWHTSICSLVAACM